MGLMKFYTLVFLIVYSLQPKNESRSLPVVKVAVSTFKNCNKRVSEIKRLLTLN